MLSLAYNVIEEDQLCLRRMDCDNFREMFFAVEEAVIAMKQTIDMKTFNVNLLKSFIYLLIRNK